MKLVFARFSVLVALMTLGFGFQGLHAQSKTSFRLGGPCLPCVDAELPSALKSIKGVTEHHYDRSSQQLTVSYDAAVTSEIDIQLELSMRGFDAGDFAHDPSANLPVCCTPAMRGEVSADAGSATDFSDDDLIEDLDDLDDGDDWENPDNLAELDRFGNRDTGASRLDDTDLLLEEEEEESAAELLQWGEDDPEENPF